MKKLTLVITTLALAGICQAADKDKRSDRSDRPTQGERRTIADIDKRVEAMNRLDNNRDALMRGMAAASKETAVPLPTIEAEHKQHTKIGVAGLFVAHELAVKTHKTPDYFIKQRTDGKSWSDLARANGQDLKEIDQKLARIEQAMRNPNAAAANTSSATDRTPVRERETARTDFDKRIETMNTLDDKESAKNAGLAALSKETAVPVTQIQQLQSQQTSAGLGDIFIAQEIATHTQKPADEFLKQHASGKSWSQIISDNNQDRSAIEQKLSRVEQAMRDADK
jgi:hypothetical protein